MTLSPRAAPLPCPPAARPFRPGDVLTASGLRGLIAGVRERQRRHLATVHGIWGVVSGLAARATSTDEQGRPHAAVDPGAAIDASGRFRTLAAPADVGPPPSGSGPWRLLLATTEGDGPAAPRWVPGDGNAPFALAPGVGIELARWRPGGALDPSFRPIARRPGARAPRGSRRASRTTRGAPVVALDDGGDWSVRVDTSSARLVGGVAYIVAPLERAAAGASWSVKTSWDDGFVLEADRWPLDAANLTAKGGPTLPADMAWIGVETSRDRLSAATAPCEPTARTPAMNGLAATSTTANPCPPDDPTIPGPPAKSTDPFWLPDPPSFSANSRLTADELTGAVAFLDAVQDLHNRLLHDWGIAAGLGVSPDPGSTGRPLRVEPGLAIDQTGREFVLEASPQIDAPPEAETRAGTNQPSDWLLVLAAPSDASGMQGVLGWRDPLARSGARVLRPGLDVVLARVSFRSGKVAGVVADDRRPIRPAAAPSVLAGSTGPGLTVWNAWYDVQPPPRGAVPRGVVTHVDAPVSGLVVLAQLAGSRIDATVSPALVLDGPSFVTGVGPGGFDFVVLFPNGPSSWGISGGDGLAHLLDRLKDPLQWSRLAELVLAW